MSSMQTLLERAVPGRWVHSKPKTRGKVVGWFSAELQQMKNRLECLRRCKQEYIRALAKEKSDPWNWVLGEAENLLKIGFFDN